MTPWTHRPRSAVTLIEILVVVAILAVLFGLSLPAVMRARESANYISCRSHLRQLGLAIHNYETTTGCFPGLGTAPQQESVLARILPYLELDRLRQRIDADRPLFTPIGDYGALDAAQAEAARTVVPLFLCPSDRQSPVCGNFDQATLAGSNYAVNTGTASGTRYDLRYPTDGVFWYGSRLRHKDMVDGLSSTMFLSEALLGAGADSYDSTQTDTLRYWLSVSCTIWPTPDSPGTTPPLSDAICMMAMPGMTWRGDRNISWIGGPGQRSTFNTALMPNDPMPDCATFGLGRFKASSAHASGVNILLGDGSVHFIKNHVEMMTWRALSTRNDGEALGTYCGCQ